MNPLCGSRPQGHYNFIRVASLCLLYRSFQRGLEGVYLRGRRPSRLDKERGVGVPHSPCMLLPRGRLEELGLPVAGQCLSS